MKQFYSLAVLAIAVLASSSAQAGSMIVALDDVTDHPGNVLPLVGVIGVHNTVAGGDTSVSIPGFPWDAPAGQYPGGENPGNAIDNNSGGETKYLNFGASTEPPDGTTQGFNTGLILNFALPTRITGMRFKYANDAGDRDPDGYSLEAGNGAIPVNPFPDVEGGDPQLQSDAGFWTHISSGPTGLVDPADTFLLVGTNRNTWQDEAPTNRPGPAFANANFYTSYRLLFDSVRNNLVNINSDMQINEIEFIGEVIVPEPSSFALMMLGGSACAFVRRRQTV